MKIVTRASDLPAPPRCWVVKLGGSLLADGSAARWMRALATHGRGRCVVVPGGGPFADQVRTAQGEHGFDDTCADQMALHAMAQVGLLLAAGQPASETARSSAELRALLDANLLAVWTPDPPVLARCAAIEASWDVTSDSLAAWLRGQLPGFGLALVKARQPLHGETSSDTRALIEEGLLDAAFERYDAAPAKAGQATVILHAHDLAEAAMLFRRSAEENGHVERYQDERPPR